MTFSVTFLLTKLKELTKINTRIKKRYLAVICFIYFTAEITNYIKYKRKLKKYNLLQCDRTKINKQFLEKISTFISKTSPTKETSNNILHIKSLLYYCFYKAPIEQIYSENIKDFLAQCILRKRRSEINHESEDIMKLYTQIELQLKQNKIEVKDGHNNKLINIYNLDNKLKTLYHPLFLKGLIRCIQYMGHFNMFLNNFEITRKKYINIWMYINHSVIDKKTIIFFPGIGIGAFVYNKLLKTLKKKFNIIILEIKQVSYYKTEIASMSDIIEEIKDTITKTTKLYNMNLTDIHIISHSYGTFIHSILLSQNILTENNKHILCDPVCFLPSSTKIAYFAFREELSISLPLITNIMRYIIFKQIDIQILYKSVHPSIYICDENIFKKIKGLIILSGQDQFIDAHEVEQYLKDNITNLEIEYNEKHIHAQVTSDDYLITRIKDFLT